MLLLFVAAGSYFLNSSQMYETVTELVQRAIPTSTQVISENLREVLDERETVGIIGLVTLLFLIYLISIITLFGAHLSAAINGWLNEKVRAAAA